MRLFSGLTDDETGFDFMFDLVPELVRVGGALSATPRHTNQLLPLLPSGPGGVYNLSLRGNQQGHHSKLAKRGRIIHDFRDNEKTWSQSDLRLSKK